MVGHSLTTIASEEKATTTTTTYNLSRSVFRLDMQGSEYTQAKMLKRTPNKDASWPEIVEICKMLQSRAARGYSVNIDAAEVLFCF